MNAKFKTAAIAIAVPLLVAVCGCDGTKNGRTKNHKELYGKQIIMPADAEWYARGRDTSIKPVNGLKIVAYYDSEGCASCKLKELQNWKPLIKEIKSPDNAGLAIDIIFIMNPERGDDQFFDSLAKMDFDYPVLCDFDGTFEKSNLLAENSLYNTFLLDEDNKILIVGSPIYNESLWSYYKSMIEKYNK